MKNVMNRENPISSWVAGVPCKESAVRKNEKTITMRVKLVINMIIDGASVRSVMTNKIRIATSMSFGWVGRLTPKFKLLLMELVAPWAWALTEQASSNTNNKIRAFAAGFFTVFVLSPRPIVRRMSRKTVLRTRWLSRPAVDLPG